MEQFPKTEYNLCALSCLFISQKFQEISWPSAKSLAKSVDNIHAYKIKREDIYHWENLILSKLRYDILHTNPMNFLSRMNQLTGDNRDVFYLAEFFLELSLYEVSFYRFTPLIIASAAIYISRLFHFLHNVGVVENKKSVWNDNLAKFTGLAYKDFNECLKLLLDFFETAYNENYRGCKKLFRKYSLPDKNEVLLKWIIKRVVIKYFISCYLNFMLINIYNFILFHVIFR